MIHTDSVAPPQGMYAKHQANFDGRHKRQNRAVSHYRSEAIRYSFKNNNLQVGIEKILVTPDKGRQA